MIEHSKRLKSGCGGISGWPGLVIALDVRAAPPVPAAIVSINDKKPKRTVELPKLLDHPLTMGRQEARPGPQEGDRREGQGVEAGART
jgi:hypothetical protein